MVKKLIVFDLDGTLAASKSSLDAEMSSLLHDLLGVVKVAIISGGAWLQFEKQVLSHLPQDDTPGKAIDSPNLWNRVLSIHRRVEEALFRRSHCGQKSRRSSVL